MFSESSTKITSGEKRRAALRVEVNALIAADKFHLTEFLCSVKEPIRTDVMMVLDGFVTNGNSPSYDNTLVIRLPDVRLMSIQPTLQGTGIKVKRHVSKRVLGTDNVKTKLEYVAVGDDATLDSVTARDVLYSKGFPVVQHRSNGAKIGTVVEVGWLLREIAKDDCLPEIKEMYGRLKDRIEKPKQAAKAA